jgi:hypothetical protein
MPFRADAGPGAAPALGPQRATVDDEGRDAEAAGRGHAGVDLPHNPRSDLEVSLALLSAGLIACSSA